MFKNSFFIIYIFLLISPNIYGQNLSILDLNDKDVSGDTVIIQGNSSDNLIELSLKVKNSSSSAIDVKVKKEELSIQAGTENYFCWKDCYQPDVFVSPDFLTIEAGAVNDRSFKGDFKPNQISGKNYIRYTFFNTNDAQDTVFVVALFDITVATGIVSKENEERFAHAYPIPSKDYVTVKYKFDKVQNLKFRIYSAQGKLIKEQKLTASSGNIVLNIEQYGSGIYFYHFVQNEHIINTGKIIFQ